MEWSRAAWLDAAPTERYSASYSEIPAAAFATIGKERCTKPPASAALTDLAGRLQPFCPLSRRELPEDVAFRVLAARNFPAHRTIRDFRAFHLKELSDLFVQVVRLAREMGLVKLGTIAVDGTKVKANASRHKAMSYERMLKAEPELTNVSADNGELPTMLAAVKANLGADASCVLADAGYRSEAVFEHLKDHPSELVVALAREGRWIAEPPNGWIKNVLGFRQFSLRGCTARKRSSSS